MPAALCGRGSMIQIWWGGAGAVMTLTARCGFGGLAIKRIKTAARGGANAAVKIVALAAEMVTSAHTIIMFS